MTVNPAPRSEFTEESDTYSQPRKLQRLRKSDLNKQLPLSCSFGHTEQVGGWHKAVFHRR